LSALALVLIAQADALRAQAESLEALAKTLASPDETDTFLDRKAAAKLAGTSWRAIRDAIRRNELPGYGRPVMVKRADLVAWLEGRRVRPVARETSTDAYLALVGAP